MRKEGTRRYPRLSVDLPARVYEVGKSNFPQVGTVTEIGLGGCLVALPKSHGTGRVLILEIDLPEETIRSVAKVGYDFPDHGFHYVGFFFDGDGKEAPAALHAYVEQNLPFHATSLGEVEGQRA